MQKFIRQYKKSTIKALENWYHRVAIGIKMITNSAPRIKRNFLLGRHAAHEDPNSYLLHAVPQSLFF
jgi:hypothetical protein